MIDYRFRDSCPVKYDNWWINLISLENDLFVTPKFELFEWTKSERQALYLDTINQWIKGD